ncbi:hypothetical protein F511_26548 [Dorcoceras hygrometricum]|uniref:Uncharacterized protein n=1 Tax=Dorcoceras hygrometricum TaxID=472368 RepID=A0A2Z7BQ60_9LAMI|nr:hypothetical protein F511_26548 [Dorcoceras hygrometricum]
MGNSSAYVSATVGSHSIEKTVLLTSASSHMFRGNSDACVSATVESLTIKKTVLLTSFHLIVFNGNRSAYWAATDSLETAVKRKIYILAKYKELLLRTIMESHRQFYTLGQPWTATASQIFDLLSDAHSKSLEDLLAQQREHGLPLAQPCPSPIVDYSVDSGAVLARSILYKILLVGVEQEERLYFVQSPESCPAASPHQESSPSSTDVSVHFDSTDVPVNAQADTHASATVDFTMFTYSLEDLRSSLFQRIHDSNSELLSKVNAVELGVRGDLLKLQVLLRQSVENACRVLERQGTTQATQINDLKKGLMAPVGTIFQDLFDIKKKQREQDAKLIALDGQIAAIRSEQLDFQTKIAADILSLSTQVGDIADYIRSGDAKKGEIGSSSRRPPPVHVERRPLPTPTNQGESSSGHGRALSVEEAAEMVREADRQADRREREMERERRLRRRGH